MNAQILSIGTELTLGQTVDTNAAWLAQRLAAVGIDCGLHVTVPDDRPAITRAIRTASAEAALVLVSGGLGPTADDLTRDALADAMGVDLRLDANSLNRIEDFFRSRGRTMRESNSGQAMVPIGARPIENTCGTAPGLQARVGDADVYVMPGVPFEMKVMFERSIEPILVARTGGAVIVQRTLHTFGMPESQLGEQIADLMRRDRNPAVGTSAADLVISIRVNAKAETAEAAGRLAETDVAELRRRLGDVVFGEDGQTLADAVAARLIQRRQTVSTAESCTGGLIAKRLTDVPGSSAYFVQGFVTYANEAKRRLLGLASELIETHGAVSPQVAEAMAVNCRRVSGTDYALAATGIAGPSGGSPDKPVGLVFVALADADGVTVKELRLGDNLSRARIRDRTAKIALNLLRLRLT